MRRREDRGQALLLVLWAMFIMSFSIIGLIQLLRVNIGTASAMERVAIAKSLAFAGTTIGKQQDFPADGKVDHRKYPDGKVLDIVVVSENSKLNINSLLEVEDRETLRSLLRLWHLTDVEADTVLDCLLDYVQPGNTRRLNGAKAEQYRRVGRKAPTGKPFRSIEEMTSVLNFDMVTRRKPEWRDYFTIYGSGKLDLMHAPSDLVKAVCRVGDSGVKALQRLGENGDLPKETAMEAARVAMGMTEKEFGNLSGRVTMGGEVRRVRATGTFAQAQRTIEAIYRPDDKTFLEWKEW
jgi:type II secretory pathway component PulK